MRLAVGGALAHHVEGPSRDAKPAHAVVDAPWPEALLGEHEALALGAEQRLARERDGVVEDFGVPAVAPELLPGVLHGGHVAEDLHAGCVGWDDEHGGALGGSRIGIGDGHDDQEVGDGAVGGEPLQAVDHPLIAAPHGAGAQLGGVGTGRVGLGHGEGAAQIAGEQRVQPAILLLGGAGHGEDLGVAGVGGGVAEGEWGDGRGAEDLVHQTELDLAHALTAELGRQVRGPQAACLDLLLQRCDGGAEAIEA